jgi:TolB-like protein/class 3 adenylate cyclase/Tfp pilus assembly protein PilF
MEAHHAQATAGESGCFRDSAVSETRKLAAILVSDVVGYSRLAGADEDRILARLRTLRSDLIDPTIAVHHGRVVKRTGDGALVEFRSVVDAVNCAIEVQKAMVERNAGVPLEKRIEFRVGIHLGDVVEESDGDLMGDGVNIAARLEGIAEPGSVCLSNAAYEQVRDKVKAEFADLGEMRLKNIVRSVRVFVLKTSSEGPLFGVRSTMPELRGPPRRSIVVLPFANIGGDPEQEYFADGVTESLTTDLSRISGAFVIARNTAFTYKGKAVDVKQIGRELNVRYVLEGSVQRGGGRMRTNVQLVDAENGNHLWAERFDKPLADFFDMQDEIVARLASRLDVELVSAEARRSERAPNPDSLDLFLQGLAWHHKGPTSENLSQARGYLERALALDPANVDALVFIAFVESLIAVYLLSDDKASRLAAAEVSLIKALSLAPEHAAAHCFLGVVLGWTKRVEQGIAECERALAIDRNMAGAHAVIGARKIYVGRAEETEAHVREALRLSPRDTLAYQWLSFVGMADIHLRRYEEAVDWLRRSIEANRNNPPIHMFLAAAHALLGQLEEARAALQAALALNPQATIARFRANFGAFSDDPVYLAGCERVFEGLRKAGLPEE